MEGTIRLLGPLRRGSGRSRAGAFRAARRRPARLRSRFRRGLPPARASGCGGRRFAPARSGAGPRPSRPRRRDTAGNAVRIARTLLAQRSGQAGGDARRLRAFVLGRPLRPPLPHSVPRFRRRRWLPVFGSSSTSRRLPRLDFDAQLLRQRFRLRLFCFSCASVSAVGFFFDQLPQPPRPIRAAAPRAARLRVPTASPRSGSGAGFRDARFHRSTAGVFSGSAA